MPTPKMSSVINSTKLVSMLVLVALAAFGLTNLKTSPDAAEAMLPTDEESLASYNDYLQRFPSDQGAILIFEDVACSDEGWTLLREIEAEFSNHKMTKFCFVFCRHTRK